MHTAWVILEVNKENFLVVLRPSSSSLFSSHHPPRAAFFLLDLPSLPTTQKGLYGGERAGISRNIKRALIHSHKLAIRRLHLFRQN